MKEIVDQVTKELAVSRDEAELIISSLLEKPRFEIYLNKTINKEQQRLLKLKMHQLKNGIPLEYITGRVQFRDYSLCIQPGVFIPRLETEYFIELIQKTIVIDPKYILDIGTGTGAIAIALSAIFPQAKIIASDISFAAISCARENIRLYNRQDRISLIQGDTYEHINCRFDLIVSNPPYIPSQRLRRLPKSVRDFEPMLALNGGKDGTRFIKKIIVSAKKYLRDNGAIALEIDETEVEILTGMLQKNISAPYAFKKDLFDKNRYLFIGNIKNEKS